MKDTAGLPIEVRLCSLIARLSREGGYLVAQADVAEGLARILQLERALGDLLDHVEQAAYQDAGGTALGAATPVVGAARAVLGKGPRPK